MRMTISRSGIVQLYKTLGDWINSTCSSHKTLHLLKEIFHRLSYRSLYQKSPGAGKSSMFLISSLMLYYLSELAQIKARKLGRNAIETINEVSYLCNSLP